MDQRTKDAALKGAACSLPRMLTLLEQLCSVDSGTGNETGNRQVIALLRPVLNELDARVEEIREPGLGTHLVAKILPEGTPAGKLLLSAHLDTVFPAGAAAEHPFHIDGDWAWGLGAGDCKSGVLISLFGALILKRAGLLPPWELTYLFSCDEETGSESGRKLFEREVKNADCALVFEGGREKDGALGFITSRRGVILGDIHVHGQEAHAGKAYLEGRSAVLELAHQIIQLYSFNDLEKGIFFNVAPISGGRPNGIVAGEAHGRFCVAGLPSSRDLKIVEERLSSLSRHITVEGCTVDVTWRTLFPALERTAENSRLCACVMEAAQALGLSSYEGDDASATDSAWISSYGVPTVDALSAMAEQIHTTEERVSISSIQQRTALCALAIRSICALFQTR